MREKFTQYKNKQNESKAKSTEPTPLKPSSIEPIMSELVALILFFLENQSLA